MTDDRAIDVGRALGQAADAQQWDAVQRILEHGWAVLMGSDPGLLRDVVNRMPDEIVQQAPRWAAARSYLDHLARGETAVTYRHTTPPTDGPGLLDALAADTGRLASRRAGGELREAAEMATAARHRWQTANDADRVAVQYSMPHLLVQWGRAHELAGDDHRARQDYVDAFDLAALAGDAMAERNAAGRLAWLSALAGERVDALRWLEQAERLPEDVERYAVSIHLACALLALDELRVDDARTHLARITPDVARDERWAAALFVKAVATDAGTAAAELDDLESVLATVPATAAAAGSNAGFVAHARGRLAALLGAPARAVAVLDVSDDGPMLAVGRALALLMLDDNGAALQAATRSRDAVSSTPRWRVQLRLVEAIALHRSGAYEAARQLAAEALTDAERHTLWISIEVVPIDELAIVAPDAWARVPDRVRAALRAEAVAPSRLPLATLTAREREVLAQLLDGASLETIAGRLFVTRNTVKSQLQSVYRKLGISSRAEAVEAARLAADFVERTG